MSTIVIFQHGRALSLELLSPLHTVNVGAMEAGSIKVWSNYTPLEHIRFSTSVELGPVLLPILHLIGIGRVLSEDVDGGQPNQQSQRSGGDEHAPGHVGLGFSRSALQQG